MLRPADNSSGAHAPRRSALFVLSTGHVALRELRPVLERFHAEGWRVVARLGASGPQASAAGTELRKQGIEAALIPPGIGYEAQPQTADIDAAGEAEGFMVGLRRQPSRVRAVFKAVLSPLFLHRLF